MQAEIRLLVYEVYTFSPQHSFDCILFILLWIEDVNHAGRYLVPLFLAAVPSGLPSHPPTPFFYFPKLNLNSSCEAVIVHLREREEDSRSQTPRQPGGSVRVEHHLSNHK